MPVMADDDDEWYGVRCVFRDAGEGAYEERITLWRASSFDDAIARAEAEAREYVVAIDLEYVGLAQAFWLFDPPGDGAEVFSLVRRSDLAPKDYIDTFFDTGTECQQHTDDS
jgi:hypothetical protein